MKAWLRRGVACVFALAWVAPLWGQGGQGGGQQGGQQQAMINRSNDPLLRSFRWREIGPIGQGGRVNEFAVVESDPRVFYVAFATAGVWKTENGGVTFRPIFDTYTTSSVGAIAVSQSNPDVLYVGTGEANNRQSSSFGDGVYRSTDGGGTFTHVGLGETQTIARIVVHPTNPDMVWVAAVGPLFGPGAERGVYRSTDGGRTWEKTLYVDEHTGATELVMDPSNPNTLFAATYQRQRTSWGFAGGGPGSGMWRSDDGGATWTRLAGNGLPNGTMGRITLDIARSNPNVMYAQIEVARDRETAVAARPVVGGGGGRGGGAGQQPPDPQRSGVWRSDDKGRTWRFLNNHNVRPMYFSILRVDPTNPEVVYTGGVQFYKSVDGGRTFNTAPGFGHVDHHAIWINPRDGNHVMIGNDGSIDISYDQARTWESIRTWSVAQPYHVSADMRRPYWVCTGLQDNGTWCGPSSVRGPAIRNWHWYNMGGGDGFYTAIDPTDYKVIYSESQNGNMNRYDLREGTGRSIRPRAPTNNNPTTNIVPAPPAGTQIRWNWNTPFILSPHNPRVIYAGGSRLFKSYDRGDTWMMSPDLTKQINRNEREIMGQRNNLPNCTQAAPGAACILSKNDGVSAYGTIVSVSESPVIPGIVWVGTDDGNIQVSRDGGVTWTDVSGNVPGGTREYYVSRVEASHFEPGTAYVSLDGHRSNDLRPYVFVTRDYGRTFTSITGDLPEFGNVNTVRQDPRNPRLLYAGTEFGFHVSLDEGGTWKKFMNNLPTVRVDDVLVHPRDNDLILATHGRGIQIMDDITPLQQMTPEVQAADAHLFEPRDAVLWKTDRTASTAMPGRKHWAGQNAPAGTAISYHLRTVPSGEVRLTITDVATGEVFRTLQPARNPGINRVQWNLRGDPPPQQQGGGGGNQQGPLARAGVYRVTLTVGGRDHTQLVRVLEDIWMEER